LTRCKPVSISIKNLHHKVSMYDSTLSQQPHTIKIQSQLRINYLSTNIPVLNFDASLTSILGRDAWKLMGAYSGHQTLFIQWLEYVAVHSEELPWWRCEQKWFTVRVYNVYCEYHFILVLSIMPVIHRNLSQ
jgi:hypothetical protein